MGQPRITEPAVINALSAWIKATGTQPDAMEIRPDGTILISRKPVDGIAAPAQGQKPVPWPK